MRDMCRIVCGYRLHLSTAFFRVFTLSILEGGELCQPCRSIPSGAPLGEKAKTVRKSRGLHQSTFWGESPPPSRVAPCMSPAARFTSRYSTVPTNRSEKQANAHLDFIRSNPVERSSTDVT